MDRLGNRHPLFLFGNPQPHEQGLGQGGGAVVHRGVDHIHAQQTGGQGLVLEDALQGALGHLRLIGGVGGEEFRAAGQAAHGFRDMMLVAAGAHQDLGVLVHPHGSGQMAHVVVEFPFALGGRQIPGAGHPAVGRHRVEQAVQAGCADGREHGGDFFGGMRQVAHRLIL